MKPTMEVQEGDRVKLGQLLFTDKKTEGVRYTAPASGVVSAINRGARRVLQSVVIDVEGDEAESFGSYSAAEAAALDPETIRKAFDALAAVKTVIFDKTGTLTQGHLAVADIHPCSSYSLDDILRFAAAAEHKSQLAQVHERIVATESEALKEALTLLRADDRQQLLGVQVRLYQALAQRWLGPVGCVACLGSR